MPLTCRRMIPPRIRWMPVALAAVSLMSWPGRASAQPMGAAPTPDTAPPILTVLSTPSNVTLEIEGPTEVFGHTPMDLPNSAVGRFSFIGTGPRIARTQGVFYLPPPGVPPYALSEPPGMSPGLLIRSLNYPGVPNITAKRGLRGVPLLLGATGGVVAGTAAHFRYRNRLDETGKLAGIRARQERRARNAWGIYAGATYAMSAVDYWIRPRFDVQEATPTRLSLVVPRVTRTGAAWRSLVLPGAGQDFANHRVRGALWLAGVLATGAGYTYAHVTIEKTKADIAWNRVLADSAGPTDQLQYLREIEILTSDLESDRDIRRGFAAATVGIYVASVIDALVMSLGPPSAEPRVSTSFPLRPDGPAVAVNIRY